MTFINWADSDEMLGLLVEYVADERSESQSDPARRAFLTELSAELADMTDGIRELSAAEAAGRLRDIRASQNDDFLGDPVLIHIEDCIEELQRIALSALPETHARPAF